MSKNGIEVLWELPVTSGEVLGIPDFVSDAGPIALRLRYEAEIGEETVDLRFLHCLWYAHTSVECVSMRHIKAYEKLVVSEKTDFLKSLLARRHHKTPEVFKHYWIFIDDCGCFEVIAKDFKAHSTKRSC